MDRNCVTPSHTLLLHALLNALHALVYKSALSENYMHCSVVIVSYFVSVIAHEYLLLMCSKFLVKWMRKASLLEPKINKTWSTPEGSALAKSAYISCSFGTPLVLAAHQHCLAIVQNLHNGDWHILPIKWTSCYLSHSAKCDRTIGIVIN